MSDRGLCYDFAKGRCNRTSCRFLHDQASGGQRDVSISDSPRHQVTNNLCLDFSRGRCHRSACRFSHDSQAFKQHFESSSEDPLQKRTTETREDYQPFICAACEVEVNYSYHGKRPPYNLNIVFLEEGYFRRDPFSAEPRALFLGSQCAMCGIKVCASPTCSLFYTKRFCIPCCNDHKEGFPVEIQREIARINAKIDAEAAT